MLAEHQAAVAGGVFLAAYAFIVSEKLHRTLVAISGAVVLILLGVLTQQQAIAAIDFGTIGLLIGMMIIVAVARRSGVFEYAAIRAVKSTGGDPRRMLVVLGAVTALASALLDNVTTVLLIAPVTFSIADELDIDVIPFLFTEIMASNIGGTATLVGDPPNIMIGSATGLGFVDFLVNLGPAVLVVFVLTTAATLWWFRHALRVEEEARGRVLALAEREAIKDWALVKQSVLVVAVTVCGFLVHQYVGLEPATVALAGASLLLLVSRAQPEEILLGVEWPTIFFFTGLFILVGGLEQAGIIAAAAREALQVSGGNLAASAVLVLWFSALASAFVDNIPFVATMIPLLKSMGQMGGVPLEPLWWSLALGACLGGNGTLVGASANVVVAGLSEKRGRRITFAEYFRVGFPAMLLSMALCTGYVYLVYLR